MSIQYLQYLHMLKFWNTLNWGRQIPESFLRTEETETYGRNKTKSDDNKLKMLGSNLNTSTCIYYIIKCN